MFTHLIDNEWHQIYLKQSPRLQRWLHNYTIDTDEATLEAKARAPLREGRVEVREKPGKPGSYYCVMYLRPHFQLDQVVTAVKLVTEMAPGTE